MAKYRVIKGGIFGGKGEVAIGDTITVKGKLPDAWVGRVTEIETTEGKEAVTADAAAQAEAEAKAKAEAEAKAKAEAEAKAETKK